MSTPANTCQWLLLVFSLPSKNGSVRVDIWRKLKRSGALALPTSGYLLPNSPDNLERFEWLSAEIRKHKGQASVAQVQSFDDLPDDLQEQSKRWAAEYAPVHAVAHWEDRQRKKVDYDQAYEDAACMAEK